MMSQARPSRRAMPSQPRATSAGRNDHHSTGVPSSRISEAQLVASHGPSVLTVEATGRPSSSHIHGQDW